MSELAEILEAVMVIMFGLSWPLNLTKCYRARTAKGTSLFFYIALEIGYAAGIISKFLNNKITYVLAFYFINFTLILACIVVYFRNKKIDKLASSQEKLNDNLE